MNLSRRSFLGSILALGVAPAIVRADSLMRIVPHEPVIELIEPMVFEWRQLEPVLIDAGAWVEPTASIDQIIAETLRSRAHWIEKNVRAHNALLALLRPQS